MSLHSDVDETRVESEGSTMAGKQVFTTNDGIRRLPKLHDSSQGLARKGSAPNINKHQWVSPLIQR
jgi:hypothetical protein